jgi:hypothetical protein
MNFKPTKQANRHEEVCRLVQRSTKRPVGNRTIA